MGFGTERMIWLGVVVGESKRRHPSAAFAIGQGLFGLLASGLFPPGTRIGGRREAPSLMQSGASGRIARARLTLVVLEAGALCGLGFKGAPISCRCGRPISIRTDRQHGRCKRGARMAAKNASVSNVQEVPPDTLGHALASCTLPEGTRST